jgi:uncharacterized protein YndB with AHSA1/START domain
VTTAVPVDQVFDYLSDFTTTTEWDPGTVRTTRVDGDGGVGTVYRNVSRFAGRETELRYEVVEHEPGSVITLRGENATVETRDRMAFASLGDAGTEVTYTADFAFKGAARLVAPLLKPALRRLGDEAEQGLSRALSRL